MDPLRAQFMRHTLGRSAARPSNPQAQASGPNLPISGVEQALNGPGSEPIAPVTPPRITGSPVYAPISGSSNVPVAGRPRPEGLTQDDPRGRFALGGSGLAMPDMANVSHPGQPIPGLVALQTLLSRKR